MSQTVAQHIPIGPVQVYFVGQRLGTSKSRAMLNWTYDLVTGGTGDNVGQINARKINEQGTIEVTIADLKTSQLRYAMAQAKSLETITSIMTANYMETITNSVMKWKEIGPLTATGTEGQISTPFVFASGSVLVYSLDYNTQYTQNTDFNTQPECAGVCRTTGGAGAITSGQYVNVHYKAYTTCSYLRGGGADDSQEGELILSGVGANNKTFQFKAWRAKREGAFPITVNEKEEYPGQTLTFRLMADVTNYTKGSQLFEVSIQES